MVLCISNPYLQFCICMKFTIAAIGADIVTSMYFSDFPGGRGNEGRNYCVIELELW